MYFRWFCAVWILALLLALSRVCCFLFPVGKWIQLLLYVSGQHGIFFNGFWAVQELFGSSFFCFFVTYKIKNILVELATTPRVKTIAHFLCQQHTWPWYTWDASSLAVFLSSLPFKTQWALNGALKLPNQQKLRADGCLLFQEQNNQAKPYEIYCMLCFYLLLNALQSWKEEVDGREEKGRGTFTLEHTGREMVQCWCNSALRRYS